MSVPWHYIQNGITQGPVPEEQLRQLITSGALHPSDQVWREGMANWTIIQATPELASAVPKLNLPPPPPTGVKKMGTGTKAAIGCGGCLGIFLLFGLIAAIAGSGSKATNTTPQTNQGTVSEPAQDKKPPRPTLFVSHGIDTLGLYNPVSPELAGVTVVVSISAGEGVIPDFYRAEMVVPMEKKMTLIPLSAFTDGGKRFDPRTQAIRTGWVVIRRADRDRDDESGKIDVRDLTKAP